MNDELGSRIKDQYENRTRMYLPRRTYTLIRLDGKSFHTYTKGLKRPYDQVLMNDMDNTAKYLCENIQGAKFAYVQSDEISILLTDFEKTTTDAWFDGNIQKMVSISASLATAEFNKRRLNVVTNKVAIFDSRVFTVPDPTEVENTLIWRQKDCVRNSISATAQSLYSHRELERKSQSDMQEMCFKKGVNWNDMPVGFKRGRIIFKDASWKIEPCFDFLKERFRLTDLIPKYV